MRSPARLAVVAALAAALAGCNSRGADGGHPPELVFGRTGVGAGEFNYPRAVAVAAPDQIYVVDKAGRIQLYSQTGKFQLAWKMPETKAGLPTGLGFSPNGNLYVADTHYSRIVIFDRAGKRLATFGSFGDGPGQFGLPTDVAVDKAGFIYVGETGENDRISKFSPQHEFILSFGGADGPPAARLARPQSIRIAPDGTLLVADACNHRICRFDADGNLLSAFGKPGHEVGQLHFPYDVDQLSDGTLVVCEYGNNRVQRFDTEGASLGVWGGPGREEGRLAYPWALAVGADDRILVVDSGNNRVQVIDGRAAGAWRKR
jgi:DNA-binding beta-propeller fold protein YncE